VDYGLPSAWVQRIRLWAAQKSEIDQVWIFGSRARGDHKPDSDIDIALKLRGASDEKDGIFLCEFDRWKREIQKFTPVKVDLDHGDEDCDSEVVVPALKREGKKIFP
jgi:uncharacterized protein